MRPPLARVIVDVQHDFLPGGALGVPNGDAIIPHILASIKANRQLVIASQDWHPDNHASFNPYPMGTDEYKAYLAEHPLALWPAHCVAGTYGAELHPDIEAVVDRHIKKGTNPNVEEYSAAGATILVEMLKAEGYQHVIVCGLATDYCVKATALDLIAAGFDVFVNRNEVAAVNVAPGDGEEALAAIRAAGGTIL